MLNIILSTLPQVSVDSTLVDTLVTTTQALNTTTPEVPEELNLWSLMLKGGFFMIPLLLLSILSIYIFVERLLVIQRAGREDNTFMERIKDYIHEGEIETALKLCKKTDTPAARLIAKGISRLGRPMNDVLVAIENVGNIEIARLEKGFPWLATTAAGAPMIGFLGTVTGMVNAFYNMASAGNNADITTLSSGIYEALVTTIAGLVVGVIALFAYNYLVARVDGVVNQLETKTMEFMDLLNEPAE
ncbi:MAG: MotA/TolQ/ExbB proton channel family protein [Bacteroidaceae bacterium]|nr:MotA/TolQ/ExbB proton channel family protein [Bacteroidaceae bacterium]